MDTNGIPLDRAELLATILEGILYGFSLLMYGGTIWVLLSQRSARQVNRLLLAAACLLLLCSTAHFIIDIIRIIEALVLYRDTYPGGPIAFLSDVSQWTFVSKNFVYAIQTLIGDGVILYRCYMVWQSKTVMILPLILWCGAGFAGIGAAVYASQHAVFGEALVHWITAFYATTFTTNMLTTILLVYRIWNIDQKASKLRGHQNPQLRQILHVIIDAGAIYNLTLIAVWICFSVKSNGQFVVLDLIMPIISITFYMVIIRVGWAIQANGRTDVSALRCLSTGNNSLTNLNLRNKMSIHITSLTENKDDNGGDPSMSPVTAVDSENRRTRFGDAGGAV